MKKLLTILLTLLMIFTLVGCKDSSIEEQPISKEDNPIIDVETPKEDDIVGGYQEVEDKNLTPELIEMFEKALDGLTGANYTPVMLEATQVVAGTNYKFKADGTKTTNPLVQGTYYVYIYKDLQGNVSLLDIEVIEEHELQRFEPEVKLDTQLKDDITNMSFWVVFYDQYGNELQREALKYGTVPTFKGSYPEGFDSWDKALVAITGNTYIHAKCHETKHSGGGSNPEPTDDLTLHKGDVIKITSESSGHQYYLVLKTNGNEATLVNHDYDSKTQYSSDDGEYENSVLDTACNTTFYGGLSSSLQNAIVEKTINLNKYTYNESYYNENTHPLNADSSSKTTVGTIDRKVYALDIEDIEGYLGSTYSIHDVTGITNGNCWLRTITNDDRSWDVSNMGIGASNRTTLPPPIPFPINNQVRPSFVVDLTNNIDYEKKMKVSLISFGGTLVSSVYANKGDKVVDMTFDGGGDTITFVQKTYGANTIHLLTEGVNTVPAFTVSDNQIMGLFTHSQLISIEKLFADEIRSTISELDPSDYDAMATVWSDVRWDQVSSELDSYMLQDIMYSFYVIDSYYATNTSAYNTIINKLKPYFVSSNLKANNNMNIYCVQG